MKENASSGRMTYVHCNAGQGRSTTIVMCYLVQHKQMSPTAAYAYVKESRPRVLLAPSQWQAILRYDHLRVNTIGRHISYGSPEVNSPTSESAGFDDASYVVVSQADIAGCNDGDGAINVDKIKWVELSLVHRAKIFSRLAALARWARFLD